MAIAPEVLNAALLEYLQTWSVREKLTAHLLANGLQDQEAEIVKELDSLTFTAEQYLFTYPGGVPWNEAFLQEYRVYVQERYPWVNDATFGRLLHSGRWTCWHDGLNAPGVS